MYTLHWKFNQLGFGTHAVSVRCMFLSTVPQYVKHISQTIINSSRKWPLRIKTTLIPPLIINSILKVYMTRKFLFFLMTDVNRFLVSPLVPELLVTWRNHHRWENQVTWRSVEWPNILLEQQPKAIEDKVCLCQSWSLCTEWWQVRKYVLLLEYLKLIVNCSCVQKGNTKQKEVIHLVTPEPCRTKQRKQSFEFYNLKTSIASIRN